MRRVACDPGRPRPAPRTSHITVGRHAHPNPHQTITHSAAQRETLTGTPIAPNLTHPHTEQRTPQNQRAYVQRRPELPPLTCTDPDPALSPPSGWAQAPSSPRPRRAAAASTDPSLPAADALASACCAWEFGGNTARQVRREAGGNAAPLARRVPASSP